MRRRPHICARCYRADKDVVVPPFFRHGTCGRTHARTHAHTHANKQARTHASTHGTAGALFDNVFAKKDIFAYFRGGTSSKGRCRAVRACMRACMRACGRACVHVCVLTVCERVRTGSQMSGVRYASFVRVGISAPRACLHVGVCMQVCVFSCMRILACVRACARADGPACDLCGCVAVWLHSCACACAVVYFGTYDVRAYKRVCMRACVRECAHASVHACKHASVRACEHARMCLVVCVL